MTPDHIVRRVREGLAEGDLTYGALTARAVGEFLGKTTSVIYSHWGSLDALLFAVAESGFEVLAERLRERMTGESFEGVAEAYVAFGLDAPDLYAVMFEHHYDWESLREAGVFENEQPSMAMWTELIEHLEACGSERPEEDARILFAGLHGLVSLAASGRANVGRLEAADREVAVESARRLVRRIVSDERDRHG